MGLNNTHPLFKQLSLNNLYWLDPGIKYCILWTFGIISSDFRNCHDFLHFETYVQCGRQRYSCLLQFYVYENNLPKWKNFQLHANKEQDRAWKILLSNLCSNHFLKAMQNHSAVMHFHTENGRHNQGFISSVFYAQCVLKSDCCSCP